MSVGQFFIIFLRIWTEQGGNDQEINFRNLRIIGGIVTFFYLMSIFKYYNLTKFLMIGPKVLHEKMAKTVIRAKKEFFDRNPSGRILNRFSTDTGLMDLMIYDLFLTCIDILSSEIMALLTLAYISSYMILPVIVILYCYIRIGLYFKKPLNRLR